MMMMMILYKSSTSVVVPVRFPSMNSIDFLKNICNKYIYFKQYDRQQTNYAYEIEIVSWNYIIVKNAGSGYVIKQSDAEALVIMDLWGMRSTHSLPSFLMERMKDKYHVKTNQFRMPWGSLKPF